MHLALLGCGLMGGSFALAALRSGLVTKVTGYSVPQHSAEHFLQQGVIHQMATSAAAAVQKADVVLIATPVAAIPVVLQQIAPALPQHCLIMDVGSTKRSVQRAAKKILGAHARFFVPTHPIAGKEQAGHAEPRATLYQDKTVVLCPDADTDSHALALAHQLWQHAGARTTELSAAAHDRGLAAVSHLPHLVAFAYMDALLNQPDHTALLDLGGPGFRDFSRIAGCEASIWRDILIDNQDEVLPLLNAVRQSLDHLEALITQSQPDVLEPVLQRASQARIHWKKEKNNV
ncbi:MAG TPA: prephenate dehydrogenase/arogenate dehydrogenase family protein [Paenalcaligenes hominis]|uniref:Prephenate dehydrogenase n=1 Tax=Paenalcaligenes hominis TaxID=643674 RepID=A0A9D2VFN9_9BURK|nr:prephenate dehydrogenase/arogenate dehydrogenase family protein [Paenalcaligenes hominis]NJB66159.1 prephenate dehydrogenase [Paenalcaligenes hominis]GGE73496.1 prephenate dehydrogenase [Paenalcaligenes hominis]HJH24113.1 prephenate dehydrogenase/arogenate dehydrogenase family protein [Paenalcaligenes hominis]